MILRNYSFQMIVRDQVHRKEKKKKKKNLTTFELLDSNSNPEFYKKFEIEMNLLKDGLVLHSILPWSHYQWTNYRWFFLLSKWAQEDSLHTLESTAHHLQGLQFAPRKSHILPLSSIALIPKMQRTKQYKLKPEWQKTKLKKGHLKLNCRVQVQKTTVNSSFWEMGLLIRFFWVWFNTQVCQQQIGFTIWV